MLGAARRHDPATMEDARTLSPGTRLGRYVISHRLARGGMAELYLARAVGADGFSKTVALKLVLPHLKDDVDFMSMLRNEAKLAAALDHPNIVQVFDLGTDRNETFIAMEYVHGVNVATLLRELDGPAPTACSLSIATGACRALHYAHELKKPDGTQATVVHRDVSPGNVLVRHDGIVKLVDFGIAKALTGTKHTRTGTIKGKAGYMSPEQCRGQPLDRRTDIYCLGILLYELTTGQRAFAGHSDLTIMNAIIAGDYARPRELDPDSDPDLEAIIVRALATDREDRYPTALALGDALESLAIERGIRTSAEGLRALLDERFGELPPATLQAATTEPDRDAATVAVPPPAAGERRTSVASYVLVAALAGGGAWVAGTWRASDSPEPRGADAPAPRQRPEPEPSPSAVEVTAPVPAAAEPSAAVPTPTPTPTPGDTPSPDPDETQPEPEPKRTAKRKAPRSKASAPPRASPDDDLRPPSMRN